VRAAKIVAEAQKAHDLAASEAKRAEDFATAAENAVNRVLA
jgi:hypothetical protein